MKLRVCAVELFDTNIRQSRNIRQFNTSKTLSSYCYDRPWGKVLKVLNISTSINVLSNPKCRFKMAFITARKRSLGQGNIFRSVCQEFCPQGVWYPSMHCSGIPTCLLGIQGVSRPTPRGEAEGSGQGGSPGPHLGGLQAQTWGVQIHTGGVVYPRMHWGRTPSCTATAVGGTRPTGMYSCFDKI